MELFSKWEPSSAGRAGAEGGGGFPALASSFGLVWELDFGDDKNTFREPEGQVRTGGLMIFKE